MSVNVELLGQTLAYIEAHPTEWHQIHYRCESGACFAGWAAILGGREWSHDTNGPAHVLPVDGDSQVDVRYAGCRDGCIHVHDAAQHLLGITNDEAEELFSAGNDIHDIRRLVEQLREASS